MNRVVRTVPPVSVQYLTPVERVLTPSTPHYLTFSMHDVYEQRLHADWRPRTRLRKNAEHLATPLMDPEDARSAQNKSRVESPRPFTTLIRATPICTLRGLAASHFQWATYHF